MPYTLNPTSYLANHLRAASYVGNDLDVELAKYDARISGSTERKQERLARFFRAEKMANVKTIQLEWAKKYQQSQIQDRLNNRAAETHL